MKKIDFTGIIELYENGNSVSEISKLRSISFSCIRRYLSKNGIKFCKRVGKTKYTLEHDTIVSLCKDGVTVKEIAASQKCSRSTIKRYLKKHNIVKKQNKRIREKNHSWNGYKELTGSFWNNIKNGAKYRGFDFLISKEDAWKQWESQGGFCAYSGVKLEHKKCKYSEVYKKPDNLASLDRKNSSIGYTVENIQWINSDINSMKQDFTEDYFLYLCNLVSYEKELKLKNEPYEEQEFGINRHFARAKLRAEKRKIQFNITKEDIKTKLKEQNCKCTYSGLKVKFGTDNIKSNNPASIDRIDSKIGYIKSNIQIVHKDINFLKLTLSEEKFLEICKQVTEYLKVKNARTI